MKNLNPSTSAKHHIGEGGEVKQAMYRAGTPRGYRFHAGTGVLNFNGNENITKPGKSFKLIPISMRIFVDTLFEKKGSERGRRQWAEIAFLNEANQVSMLMFHGYSVENLIGLESELYYEGLKFDEIVLEVDPQEKISSNPEAENATYYIADFDFEKAEEEVVAAQKEAIKNMPIYRLSTYTGESETLLTLNYPLEDVQRLAGVEDKPENVKQLEPKQEAKAA